jgi:hypothetical protein
MKTTELIEGLSQDAPKPQLKSPAYFGWRLGLVLIAYGVATQLFLHLRPDLLMQLARPTFALEILLLTLLTACSTAAAIFSMYPDSYQKSTVLKLPYIVFGVLFAFILAQLLMPQDTRMVIPNVGAHSIECTLCIASVSLIPSALIFSLLRKGASVHPLTAGSFAVLAASGIGCLTLRLSEMNDSLIHLVSWHYLPILLFAFLGAIIGQVSLKW